LLVELGSQTKAERETSEERDKSKIAQLERTASELHANLDTDREQWRVSEEKSKSELSDLRFIIETMTDKLMDREESYMQSMTDSKKLTIEVRQLRLVMMRD